MQRWVLMLSERKSEASWKKMPPPPLLPSPGPWAGTNADFHRMLFVHAVFTATPMCANNCPYTAFSVIVFPGRLVRILLRVMQLRVLLLTLRLEGKCCPLY